MAHNVYIAAPLIEFIAEADGRRLDYRDADRERFYDGLRRNGPKAVAEFDVAFD